MADPATRVLRRLRRLGVTFTIDAKGHVVASGIGRLGPDDRSDLLHHRANIRELIRQESATRRPVREVDLERELDELRNSPVGRVLRRQGYIRSRPRRDRPGVEDPAVQFIRDQRKWRRGHLAEIVRAREGFGRAMADRRDSDPPWVQPLP